MLRTPTSIVLREELVALTQDYKKAIILGKMLELAAHASDVASFVREETSRFHDDLHNELHHGWFHKRAEDLSSETLLGMRSKAMRAHLKSLVESEWLFEKRNPECKMDHTLRYRVNLVQIQRDLHALGWEFTFCPTAEKETPTIPIRPQKILKENPLPTPISSTPFGENRVDSACLQGAPSAPTRVCLSTSSLVKTKDCKDLDLEKQDLKTSKKTKKYKTQQHSVCVQKRIFDLFKKNLSLQSIQQLITLAKEARVNLDAVINNTYEFHTKVEPCWNVFGAIRHAIQCGGWEIIKKPTHASGGYLQIIPMPKCVQNQGKYKKAPPMDPAVLLEKQNRIREKLAASDLKLRMS